MKKFFMIIVLVFILLISYYSFFYGVENRQGPQQQPQHQQPRRETPTPQPQQPKPILPPAVPSSSSGVSPTLSPHIATPPIGPSAINVPPRTTSTFPETRIPSLPSVPAPPAVPTVPVQASPPQVPLIGNTMGEVLDIGEEEDGTPWIEVKDDLFDLLRRIKVEKSRNTPIVKKAAMMRFEDIQIGDIVNVIFSSEGEDDIANVINILTEEDLELMEQETQPGLIISPDKSEDSNESMALEEKDYEISE